jgi:hypothetical protein
MTPDDVPFAPLAHPGLVISLLFSFAFKYVRKSIRSDIVSFGRAIAAGMQREMQGVVGLVE